MKINRQKHNLFQYKLYKDKQILQIFKVKINFIKNSFKPKDLKHFHHHLIYLIKKYKLNRCNNSIN